MKREDADLARRTIECILKLTKLAKMRSIYAGIEPAADGAVHSFQNPAGTETTRRPAPGKINVRLVRKGYSVSACSMS